MISRTAKTRLNGVKILNNPFFKLNRLFSMQRTALLATMQIWIFPQNKHFM